MEKVTAALPYVNTTWLAILSALIFKMSNRLERVEHALCDTKETLDKLKSVNTKNSRVEANVRQISSELEDIYNEIDEQKDDNEKCIKMMVLQITEIMEHMDDDDLEMYIQNIPSNKSKSKIDRKMKKFEEAYDRSNTEKGRSTRKSKQKKRRKVISEKLTPEDSINLVRNMKKR